MKIGFAVNDVGTEKPGYTTVRLAMAAINRGHSAFLIGAGDFAYDKDERYGRLVPQHRGQNTSLQTPFCAICRGARPFRNGLRSMILMC
jgi:glutathione synthase